MSNPADFPMVYSVPEALAMLGICRSTFYRQVRRGNLRLSKIGARTVVQRHELERLIGAIAPAAKEES
ncbi:MAG TPA: helix-turn-helix domain-containing protein [Caulobacteraceae bacterium]|jgi:hypothetical protein